MTLILVLLATLAGCRPSHCECYDSGSYKDGPPECVKTCAELFV